MSPVTFSWPGEVFGNSFERGAFLPAGEDAGNGDAAIRDSVRRTPAKQGKACDQKGNGSEGER